MNVGRRRQLALGWRAPPSDAESVAIGRASVLAAHSLQTPRWRAPLSSRSTTSTAPRPIAELAGCRSNAHLGRVPFRRTRRAAAASPRRRESKDATRHPSGFASAGDRGIPRVSGVRRCVPIGSSPGRFPRKYGQTLGKNGCREGSNFGAVRGAARRRRRYRSASRLLCHWGTSATSRQGSAGSASASWVSPVR